MLRTSIALAALLIGCSHPSSPSDPMGDDDDVDPTGPDAGGCPGIDLDAVTDPLSPELGFKTGAAQLADLCARNHGDAVSTAFCAGGAPPIASLVDLQKLVGLDFQAGNNQNGRNGNPAFALTGHSSSLVTRFTSAINPRAIIFTPPDSTGRVNNPQPLDSFVAMGFVRGEQFVELVANDPTADNQLRFFLFRFEQACNAGDCSYDDLLTPKVESNFTAYTLYEDVDIKNTVFDCLQCHQAAGPSATKMLRMQELQNPWGHFFRNNRDNGQEMLADYGAAHTTAETYAGIPGAAITNSDPAQLEGLVENQGFKAQPNEFNTNQLLDNGASQQWLALYNNSKQAKQIPVPYHENRVTDPAKLASATTAYKAAMTGTPLTTDIRDVFLDAALADMTFRPAADLVAANDGKGILVQMCQQCHNSALDQTLTRARFDVTRLDTMSRAEKDLAIKRLGLAADAARRMPPERFRSLSAAEIALVTTELMK